MKTKQTKDFALLNWYSARRLMHLMYACYRHGALDACELNDDFKCQEFLEHHTANGTYGTLDMEGDMSRNEWIFTLQVWCRMCRQHALFNNYIEPIRTSHGIYAVTFPVLMDYYMMGVRAWLDYPNPIRRGSFERETRSMWKPASDGSERVFTNDIFTEETQRACFNRRRHFDTQKEALKEEMWEDFALAFRCVTRDKTNRRAEFQP